MEARNAEPRRNPLPWVGWWRLVAPLLLSLAFAPAVPARADGWRLFAGTSQTDWRILGRRGHAEDCRTRACDDRDLSRGNLDRSIAYRIGAERSLLREGRWELFGGTEIGLVFTEYNSSQRDVRIAEAFAAVGGRVDLGPVAVLAQAAGGGATFDDGHSAPAHFFEGALEVPFGRRAGVRLGARLAKHGGPRSQDYSLLVVESGGPPREEGDRWRLGWAVGLSDPGSGAGKSLALSVAPFSRISVLRVMRSKELFGLSLQTSAHESEAKTEFFGVSGNERGKTIHGAALTWQRESAGNPFRWRYGVGIEFTNWDDDYGLLVESSGRWSDVSLDVALLASIEGALSIGPGTRLVLGAEKAYWSTIGLGELRIRLGIEISP